MEESSERGGVRVWRAATGILLVAVGFGFLLVPLLATLVAGIAAGTLLLVSGVAQVGDAIGHPGPGRGWAAAAGILAAAAGVLLLVDPRAGVLGLTVLLAAYLIAAGVFRLVLAAAWRPTPGSGWALLNGLCALALGVVVLVGWPTSALWTLGIFLGIDAVLAGFGRVANAIAGATPGVPTERRV